MGYLSKWITSLQRKHLFSFPYKYPRKQSKTGTDLKFGLLKFFSWYKKLIIQVETRASTGTLARETFSIKVFLLDMKESVLLPRSYKIQEHLWPTQIHKCDALQEFLSSFPCFKNLISNSEDLNQPRMCVSC